MSEYKNKCHPAAVAVSTQPETAHLHYRYICAKVVDFDGPVSDYRLVSSINMGDRSCYRVRVPDDFILKKYGCDNSFTTQDTRSLNELGYDVMVKIDGRWRVRNDFRGLQFREIYSRMMRAGLHPVPKLGYLTQQRYELWAKEISIRKHTGKAGQWVHIVSKTPEPKGVGGYTLKEIVFCNRCGFETQNGVRAHICPNCKAVMDGDLTRDNPWL